MDDTSLRSTWISKVLGLDAPVENTFSEITSDSRKVAPNSLFVCLPGDAFDGHDFIADAIKKGARGILGKAEKLKAFSAPGVSFFQVDDPVHAYRKLAHDYRSRFQIPIFGIAGSEGKTTTKHFLFALLRGKYAHPIKTLGSQNGFIGIPMTLFQMGAETDAAVVEIGIDELGAMQQHLELVEPSSVCITSIGPEHLEKLLTLENVITEETLAVKWAHARGQTPFVLSFDDPQLAATVDSLKGPELVLTSLCDLSALKACAQKKGCQYVFGEYNPKQPDRLAVQSSFGNISLPLPLPGRHNAQNLLTALGLALASVRFQGLRLEECKQGLELALKEGPLGAPGRSQVRTLVSPKDPVRKVRVICDFYNANPTSMRAGLSLLLDLSQGRSIAVLGDMLELGTETQIRAFHDELKDPILASRASPVFLVGPRMQTLSKVLTGLGISCQWSTDKAETARALEAALQPGDTVLLKGSRGMKMEEILKLLGWQETP